MGRQFNYYCLPEDLAEIQSIVFSQTGGQLYAVKKEEGTHRLVPEDCFALERQRMGKETLLLLLLPPATMSHVVYAGSWLDTANSHVIEVGRCYTDGSMLRAGRFWYEPKTFVDGVSGEKPHDFVSWAQTVFRLTKALLQRQTVIHSGRSYVEWFGKHAWSEVKDGHLHVVAN